MILAFIPKVKISALLLLRYSGSATQTQTSQQGLSF